MFRKTYKPPFHGWLITATTSRNHAAIPQKEAVESLEMERFWLIKYQTKRLDAGKLQWPVWKTQCLKPQRVCRRFCLASIGFINNFFVGYSYLSTLFDIRFVRPIYWFSQTNQVKRNGPDLFASREPLDESRSSF